MRLRDMPQEQTEQLDTLAERRLSGGYYLLLEQPQPEVTLGIIWREMARAHRLRSADNKMGKD